MRRRRVIVGLVVLALVGGAVAVLWLRQPRPGRATFEQVREGMTYDDVCATIGAPPGAYTWRPHRHMMSGIRDCRKQWVADDGELIVWFGDDDRVTEAKVFDLPNDPRPLHRRILSRLGL